jgi:uncharacterized protein (TIGR02271 family)
MFQEGTVRPGMRVLDMSGTELGTVEQLFLSPDGGSYRLVLGGGQIRVPGDLVDSVRGDELRLALRADTVRSTAWGPVPSDYVAAESFELRGGGVDAGETLIVPRHEERLQVDTVMREVGQVSVSKRVVEEVQTIPVEVNREVYEVRRVDVNRPWQQGDDAPRTEGDTMIVPIISEKIEVIRRRVVTGELHLTKRLVTEQREITESVRREEVEVTGPPGVIQGDAGSVPAS